MWHVIMNRVTMGALIYMTIDFILLWVINEPCMENVSPSDEEKQDQSKIFEKSLHGGALGNLKKSEE